MFQRYKEIHELSQIMGFKIPLDGLMMIALQRPVIDIVKLDEALINRYDYNGSMKEFIMSKFGNRAVEILENDLK